MKYRSIEVSKVILVALVIRIALLCDWLRKLAPPSHPIKCKNQNKSQLAMVSRLPVFTLSSHWLLMMLTFVLISRCCYFSFRFSILNLKVLQG